MVTPFDFDRLFLSSTVGPSITYLRSAANWSSVRLLRLTGKFAFAKSRRLQVHVEHGFRVFALEHFVPDHLLCIGLSRLAESNPIRTSA